MKNYLIKVSSAIYIILLCAACNTSRVQSRRTLSGLNPKDFVTIIDQDKDVKLYQLINQSGMEVCVTNFGARIVSIMVPDKKGKMEDVVLGFDNIRDYVDRPNYFGASIGRYANRINKGLLCIDGKKIQLPTNNFGHCLHGGPQGWADQVYQVKQFNDSTLQLVMDSKDGDQNFPGHVIATITYLLKSNNALAINYEAVTDKTTVINMTNHSFFNLSGNPSKTAMNHYLYISSDSITPIDSTSMTTGKMMAVANTPFDFRKLSILGQNVNNFKNQQIKNAHGIDHNWVLNTNGDIHRLSAQLTSPSSGITLKVYTTEPGIQIYTSNFLNGTFFGKQGINYSLHSSVCLETQHYPDSPNKPYWPSTFLKAGEKYHSQTIFKFE